MLRKVSLVLILPTVFAIVLPLSASAADCSSIPGTHPAAANEVPGVAAGTCTPNQGNNILNGGCDSNPYPYLEQHKSGNVQLTPSSDSSNLKNGINPALACRLSKLIQAFATKGCQIRIISAYRSAQQQQDMCGAGRTGCAPPGASCHQYGLAVDISSNCTAQLRQYLGTKNPSASGAQQFKLHFPYYGDHIQCSENVVASCSQATQPCDGSVRITPNLSTIPNTSNVPFDQQVRQALGMQQPPPPPPPPPPPQPQQQPQPTPITPQTQNPNQQTPPPIGTQNSTPYPPGTCNPQTYCSQNDGNIYYRASTCVDQKYQTCRNGCSGITCTSTSSALSSQPLSDLFSQYNNTQSPGDRATTSAFDLIDFFANPYQSTSTSIGTTTPIVLNQNIENGDNASVLSPGSGTTSVQLPPGTTVVLGGTQNQTFTSGDLHNSPLPYNGVQNSGALAILANMKAALINALHYLQPFGGRVGGSL